MSCLLSLLEGLLLLIVQGSMRAMSSGACAGHPPCFDESHCYNPRFTLATIAGRVRVCSGDCAGVAYSVLTNEGDHVVSLACVACCSSTLHAWVEGRNPSRIPGVSHWPVMKECALCIPYGGMVSDARGRVWQVPPRGIAHTVPLSIEHYPARSTTAPSAARRRRGRALHGPL